MTCIVIEFFDGVDFVTRNCILGKVCFMVADHYSDGTHKLLYNGRDRERVISLLSDTNELTVEALDSIKSHKLFGEVN